MAIAKNLHPFPKIISLEDFKGYAKVTEENKKSALVLGRACYIIVPKDKKSVNIKSQLEVRYRLKKGRVQISNHPAFETFDFFCFEDETVADYRQTIGILNHFVKEGNLYIKLGELLIKFEFI